MAATFARKVLRDIMDGGEPIVEEHHTNVVDTVITPPPTTPRPIRSALTHSYSDLGGYEPY